MPPFEEIARPPTEAVVTRKAGHRLGAGEVIPERAGVTEDLHRSKGRGGEGIVDKQNCDVDHTNFFQLA
jgi:hypothetical protein